jgi:hypothetical protein
MAAGVVEAESWLAMPTADDNVLFAVDEASLVRDGDTVKFFERLVYVEPRQRDPASGSLIKEKRMGRVMNCVTKTHGHDFGSLIGVDGRRIETVHIGAAEIRITAVPAGTLAERELAWACATGKK